VELVQAVVLLPSVLFCVLAWRVHRKNRAASRRAALLCLGLIPLSVAVGSKLIPSAHHVIFGIMALAVWVPVGGLLALGLAVVWQRRRREAVEAD